jgi:hypothetical protein
MTPQERDPRYMIDQGMLEPVEDFEHNGQAIPASRLGYRITDHFIRWFFGRIFDNPNKLFDESILRPEKQDLDAFADGILYITEAQQQVAQQYLDDGSIDDACPPLQALLTIMATGSCDGKTERDPEIRELFTRKSLLDSDWYKQRLQARQQRDVLLWSQHVEYLQEFTSNPHNADVIARMNLTDRQQVANEQFEKANSETYLQSLIGTIGTDVF